MSDFAVAVCGFPRCGSSLMMRMLDVGGIAPVEGSSAAGYELDSPCLFPTLTREQVSGRAVKLLDAIVMDLWPTCEADWRIIWLHRNLRQQARSNVKMLRAFAPDLDLTPDAEEVLRRSYVKDEPRALQRLAVVGAVRVVTFEDLLRRPLSEAHRIAEFLGPRFDPRRAASIVERRSPLCAPDSAREIKAATR